MKAIRKLANCPVFVCSAITAISLLALSTALVAQYMFGLAPCILCLYQRVPFIITAILGATGLFVFLKYKNTKIVVIAATASAVSYLTGSLIALYHSGVERHWWASFLEGCSVDFSKGDILAQIEQATAVRCDEIPWADPIFGLSMANYNVAFSAGLALACFICAVTMKRRPNVKTH